MTNINAGAQSMNAWDDTRTTRRGTHKTVDAAIASDLKGKFDSIQALKTEYANVDTPDDDKAFQRKMNKLLEGPEYTIKEGDTFWDVAEAIKTINKEDFGNMDTGKLAAQLQAEAKDPKGNPITDPKNLPPGTQLDLDSYLV
jgi:hypothetical protein